MTLGGGHVQDYGILRRALDFWSRGVSTTSGGGNAVNCEIGIRVRMRVLWNMCAAPQQELQSPRIRRSFSNRIRLH